jgi:endonuclease/exonuclease/phosphatase family metal-dependent hydrolase
MRTGAAGAVGAKYLAREDSITAGIIGTGAQGKAQLLFLFKVRRIKKAFAHSGRRKDEEYAREMSTRLDIDVVASNEVEEGVRNADGRPYRNKIHDLLAKYEYTHDFSDLFGKEGVTWLKTLKLSQYDQVILDARVRSERAAIPVHIEVLKPLDKLSTRYYSLFPDSAEYP